MKAILFDLGRVLIHYDHVQTMHGLATLTGCPEPVIRARFAEIRSDLEIGALDTDALLEWVRTNGGGPALDYDPFFAAFTSGMGRDEDALAYALALEARPDLLVAALSNTNETHIRWLDAHVPELNAFDLVIYSSEVAIGKPAPEFFRLALELLEVEPAQALFIDDLAENVRAAEALGIGGIVHQEWSETRARLEAWLDG